MITKINKLFRAGLLGCAISAALVACTDTWDDHYGNTIVEGVNEGSLWEAIKHNPDLSNFASVIEATGYDVSLGSSQVFTVFAPTNDHFSKAEADALIEQYKLEKQSMNDDDNTVIKEFVRNHIALYNYAVSPISNDSIVLMNGKYALLRSNKIENSGFKTFNQLYENGVLYTVDKVVDYSANIFEKIRKDADLDSVRSFLYNPKFYKKMFSASSSVEGGIDDLGRTVYLDSVFYQANELFDYLGSINSEDSTYWMVLPTNEAWSSLVDEYSQYFNYADNVQVVRGDRDSLIYTNTRLAILEGTAFSRTNNNAILTRTKTTTTPKDSVSSVNAKLTYARRLNSWNTNFTYYQYFDPLNGVLNEDDSLSCSNGLILKSDNWKIDKLQTFHRWIVVEAEGSRSLREIGKTETNKETKDSMELAKRLSKDVYNPNFKNKVWGDSYAEFVPTTTNPTNITFNITNVLSNIGYDIYLVTTPTLANDSNATATELLPTTFRCTLGWREQTGETNTKVVASSVTTSGSEIDYLLLASDFKFPVATRGITEEKPSVTLKIDNRVTNRQEREGTHTKVMRFDCILLVPHGTLKLVDDMSAEGIHSINSSGVDEMVGQKGVLMYPFGTTSDKWYYKLR